MAAFSFVSVSAFFSIAPSMLNESIELLPFLELK